MRVFRLSLLLCGLISFSGLFAQTSIPPDIEIQFSLYGETWLKVPLKQKTDLQKLSDITSVAGVSNDSALLNVNQQEFEQLIRLGFPFLHVPAQRISDEALMSPAAGVKNNWDYYPTWQEYDSMMHAFALQYPALCTTHNMLTLASSRKLLVTKLTSGNTPAGGKPLFLYSSTMHGNELAGYILLLRLIDHLLSGYGIDPEVTWLLDHMEIWICPLANPDGTYYGGNHTVAGSIRRNANNVDLNRNYPDPRVGANPDGKPYQPETIAFIGLADTLTFTAGANMHSGIEVVNFPWDTWTKLHTDNNWWVQVSRAYADTVQANAPAGFMDDLDNGITNGAAWYVITGGRQDYMNYFVQCREFTLEVSTTFILPANQLNNMWNYHHRAMINYLKEGWYGVRGVVTDSVTGLPLRARVWVNAHDADSSHVWSSASSGFFSRPIDQGSYSITWSAPGYHPKTMTISVLDHDTTEVNVQLVPIGFGLPENDPGAVRLWYRASNSMICLDKLPRKGTVLQLFAGNGSLLYEIKDPSLNTRVEIPSGMYVVSLCTPDGLCQRRKLIVP
jgi:hypothetical protein